MSISDGVKLFLVSNNFDDLGAIYYTTLLYKIIADPLIVDFSNVLLGSFTAVSLYKLGKYFMNKEYAFFFAILYSTSSFVIYFHISLFKETVFVFLIAQIFLSYYKFLKNKNIRSIIVLVLFLLILFLFRPAVSLLIIISIFGGSLSNVLVSKKGIGIVLISIIFIYIFGGFIETLYTKFLGTSDFIDSKESIVYGSWLFTYVAAIISALFGPLPTLLNIPGKETLSFYGISLFIKLFVNILFIFGVIDFIKRKQTLVFPIMFFVLLEMLALTLTLESFELRKSIAHTPFIYLIAFKFVNDIAKSPKQLFPKGFVAMQLMVFIFIIYWNLRLF